MSFGIFEDDNSAFGGGGGGGIFSPTQEVESTNVLHSIFSPPQQQEQRRQNQRATHQRSAPDPRPRRPAPPPPPPPPSKQQQNDDHVRPDTSKTAASSAADPAASRVMNSSSSKAAAAAAAVAPPPPPPPPPPPRRQQTTTSTAITMNQRDLPSIPEGRQMANTTGSATSSSRASDTTTQSTAMDQTSSTPAAVAQPPPPSVQNNIIRPINPIATKVARAAAESADPSSPVVVDASTSPAPAPHDKYSSPPKLTGDIPRNLSIGALKHVGGTSGIISSSIATTPSANVRNAADVNTSSNDAASPPDLFMSPISVLTEATKSVVAMSSNVFAYDATNNNISAAVNNNGNSNNRPSISSSSAFQPMSSQPLPPLQHAAAGAASSSSVSASVVTYNNKIPIEMLDFEYVTKCESAEELRRIVAVLSEESPPRYPSLLRIAKNRLDAVLVQEQASEPTTDSSSKIPAAGVQEQPTSADNVNDISLACKSESFESAVDPGPVAAATAILAAAGVESYSNNNSKTKEEGVAAESSATTYQPTHQQIAPLVISTGKRVNFAPPLSGRSSIGDGVTPRSELAGFAIVDDAAGSSSGYDQDVDSLIMDLSASSYGGSRASRASTRLSISRGCEGGVGLTPSANSFANMSSGIVEVEPRAPKQSQEEDSDTDGSDDELKDNLASVLAEHSMLKSEIDAVVEERDALKVRLASQTVELRDLEGRIAKQQADFDSKTKALEEAKSRSEAELAALEGTVVNSTDEAREVMMQLKTREREALALRQEIRLIKKKRRKEYEASSDLHDELLAEIAHCTEELNMQKQRSAEALQSLKNRLNSEFEEVLSKQKARIDNLTHNLSTSQSEVERLKDQKMELSRALQAVRTNVKQNALSRIDRRKDVEEAVAKSESSEAAANAMAKALAISEKELVEALHRKDRFERQCVALKEENSLLLQENRKLSERIQTVHEELAGSHSYIDTLHERVTELETANFDNVVNLKKKLRSVQRDYASQLHELKSKQRDESAWVPIDMYKKAVRDLKKKEDEVHKLSSKLKRAKKDKKAEKEMLALKPSIGWKDMTNKYNTGDSTDKENHASNDIPRQVTISLETDDKKQTSTKVRCSRRVSPTNSDKTEVKAAAKALADVPMQVCVPAAKGKQLARMHALQTFGGKKGLAEKLRKARGKMTSPQ